MIREITLKDIFKMYLHSHKLPNGLTRTHRGYKADITSNSLSIELIEKTKVIMIEEKFIRLDGSQYRTTKKVNSLDIVENSGNIEVLDKNKNKKVFLLVSDKDILRIASLETPKDNSVFKDTDCPQRLHSAKDNKPKDTLF